MKKLFFATIFNRNQFRRCCGLILLYAFMAAGFCYGAEANTQIPSEYQSGPGLTLGLNNSGVAAFKGIEGLQINPALLGVEKQYTVNGTYYWPNLGRDFYHAGVIDSQTAGVAAAASYTGFVERFKEDDYRTFKVKDDFDSQTTRRLRLGFGQILNPSLAVGASMQYLQAKERILDIDSLTPTLGRIDDVKGTALNLGVAGAISATLLYGVSVENIANKKIQKFAPSQYRAGLSYQIGGPNLIMSADFNQRERIPLEQGPLEEKKSDLQNVNIGMMAKVYDVFRLLTSYGQELNDKHRALSGGIALVNKKFTISYLVRRGDLENSNLDQAINMNLAVAF